MPIPKLIKPALVLFFTLLCSHAYAANTESTSLWASGNEDGVYLVVAKERHERRGFQIYHRAKTDDHFKPGQWYAGQPLTVTLHNDRLMVFLEGGGCQSYDLYTSRTERRLPTGLVPVSSASQGRQLFVLAQADQPVRLKASDSLLLDKNDWALLTLDADRHWKSITPTALPLNDLAEPSIAIHNESIHLFSLHHQEASPQLLHAQIRDGQMTDPEIIPINHPVTAKPVIVNKQLRLIIQSTTTDQLCESVLAWQSNGQWVLSSPLQRQDRQPLITKPGNLVLASLDQTLIAFERPDAENILYGFYRTDGQLEHPLTQPISLIQRETKEWILFFSGPQAEMIILVIVLFLLYTKRQEAFFDLTPLPAPFAPAAFWRRALAWFLDFFPVTLISWLIVLPFYPELQALMTDQSFLFSPSEGMHDLATYEAMTVLFLVSTLVFALYQILWESFIGASPGKKALRLYVIDYQGEKPQLRQTLIRNVYRLIETLPMIILLLLLFTRRRQRIGDLMAQTVVTEKKKPE